MSEPLRIELQISEAQALPNPSGKVRWSVRAKVLQVLSGSLPSGTGEITLLVHSPTKAFATSPEELPSYVFTLEFKSPWQDPYAGEFQVLNWHKRKG
ncbi:MAG: hypothetical protein LAO20_00425 [Acidobacteriia bacterium]|nr:hypothetical protein [Terriglobia bacterium]